MPTPTRPPTLRLLQGLAVTIARRDAVGARQGLRLLLDLCDDAEAVAVLRLLEGSLSPQERFWFGSLDGPRKGLQAPPDAAGKLTTAAA